MRFPIYIRGETKDVETNALLDSGASGLFIHWDFVKKHRIPTKPYTKPRIIRNVDHSFNALGKITNYVETTLTVGDHEEKVHLAVTDLGTDNLILGLPWLRKHNPHIDWSQGQLKLDRCPLTCKLTMKGRRRQKLRTTKVAVAHTPAIRHGGIRKGTPPIKPPDSFAQRIRAILLAHRE